MEAHQAPPSLGFSRQEHWSGLPPPSPMHESEKWKWSRSVVPDSSQPHGLQPTRLPHPWDSPGKNTGVGCHFPLQSMKVKMNVKSLSRVWLSATPWTAAHQAPLSMGSSRQEYWSGVPLPSLNYQLNNLFNTLKGDPDLNSPHSLPQEAWEELCLVQNKLQKQFLTHIKLDLPLKLFTLPSPIFLDTLNNFYNLFLLYTLQVFFIIHRHKT